LNHHSDRLSKEEKRKRRKMKTESGGEKGGKN